MADLTITAANVVKGTGASISSGTAGGSITAGQSLYIDTANGNVLKPADTDAAALSATAAGIALHASSTGQPIAYLTQGAITIGATLTAGQIYVVSATAGGIAPITDATTGWYVCILGYASSTSVCRWESSPPASLAKEKT